MDHTIGNIKLHFKIPNDDLARSFHANWETIFHNRFEKITDKILSKYDQKEEIIEIPELMLDLGTISEVYFEENWLLIYEEKLDTAMIRFFSYPEN
ncbi:MAG: contractile injection system tape measure protein, partial [Bacteroidales bacterium]